MIDYTWKINSLDCHTNLDGKTNVVYTIHWSLIGEEDTNTASVYSSASVEVPEGSAFVEYDDLTQDIVVEWLENSIGSETITAHKENIANQIDLQKAPVTVNLAPSWV